MCKISQQATLMRRAHSSIRKIAILLLEQNLGIRLTNELLMSMQLERRGSLSQLVYRTGFCLKIHPHMTWWNNHKIHCNYWHEVDKLRGTLHIILFYKKYSYTNTHAKKLKCLLKCSFCDVL